MTSSRGRPRKNNLGIEVQLSGPLISEIKSKHPELLRPDGTFRFRHGAMSEYIERTLWKELRNERTKISSQIISGGLASGRPEQTGDGGGDNPGPAVRDE